MNVNREAAPRPEEPPNPLSLLRQLVRVEALFVVVLVLVAVASFSERRPERSDVNGPASAKLDEPPPRRLPMEGAPGLLVARDEPPTPETSARVAVAPDEEATERAGAPALAGSVDSPRRLQASLATVVGRVRTTLGARPAKRASVELSVWRAGAPFEAPPELLLVRTDTDGNFRAQVGAGELRAIAWTEASTGAPTLLTLAPGETGELELVLAPAAPVGGRVLDPAGRPVAGAAISFWTHAERDVVHTATDGTFLHPRFPAGELLQQVRVTADGFGATVRYLDVDEDGSWELAPRAAGEAPLRGTDAPWLELVLVPELAVTGRLASSTGAPPVVADVRAEGYVHVLPDVASLDAASVRVARDGSFRIEGLRSDVSHALFVEATGFARLALEVPAFPDVVEFHVVEVGTLQLEPETSVVGVVIDGEGRPVVDIAVELELRATDEASAHSSDGLDAGVRFESRTLATRTDGAGTFVIDGLTADAWTLRVRRDRDALLERELELVPGEARRDLVLALPVEALVLIGEVHDATGAVAGAEVALKRFGDVTSVVTDELGRFRIAGLDAEAAYEVVARGPARDGGSPARAHSLVWGWDRPTLRLSD